ncbi:MAG: membrane-bound lytic murein transglycosylase MltF, partial [Oceanisphaera sp.]
RRDTDAEDLLRQVAEGKADYTLVSDLLLARTQRYYPNVQAAFTLGDPQPVAWMLPNSSDDSMLASMLDFFNQQYDSGNLAHLHEKYFGHVQSFDYVDTRTFLQRIDKLLPQYRPLFERHAGELDWRLLAAMSYQESHWDPEATSYTGVRGMMMLTEDTAAQVGVKNRLDPEQSIRGGAQYLTSLIERLPESIPDGERIWFALAAYNIGLGHVLDVRRLTQTRQQDPNSWAQVKANLPLLHQPQWYKQTRYGYARGRETKQFVNNIRQYYQSLLWQDNAQTDASLAAQHDPLSTEPDIY